MDQALLAESDRAGSNEYLRRREVWLDQLWQTQECYHCGGTMVRGPAPMAARRYICNTCGHSLYLAFEHVHVGEARRSPAGWSAALWAWVEHPPRQGNVHDRMVVGTMWIAVNSDCEAVRAPEAKEK